MADRAAEEHRVGDLLRLCSGGQRKPNVPSDPHFVRRHVPRARGLADLGSPDAFAPVAALLAVVLSSPALVLPFYSGVFMERTAGFIKLYFPLVCQSM